MAASRAPLRILVVDDHDPTARLIGAAFDEVNDPVTTTTVSEGQACLAVLRGDHEEIGLPDIILLDLGLPDIDGVEVLERIREDPSVRHLPVVVLSGRTDEDTIKECYEAGANTFISKPEDFDEYVSLAKRIVDYWGTGAELPSAGS